MVAFYPHFVSCGEKATLKDVVGELNDFNSIISLGGFIASLYYLASLRQCLIRAIQLKEEGDEGRAASSRTWLLWLLNGAYEGSHWTWVGPREWELCGLLTWRSWSRLSGQIEVTNLSELLTQLCSTNLIKSWLESTRKLRKLKLLSPCHEAETWSSRGRAIKNLSQLPSHVYPVSIWEGEKYANEWIHFAASTLEQFLSGFSLHLPPEMWWKVFAMRQ